jgi:hypothetical protein
VGVYAALPQPTPYPIINPIRASTTVEMSSMPKRGMDDFAYLRLSGIAQLLEELLDIRSFP